MMKINTHCGWYCRLSGVFPKKLKLLTSLLFIRQRMPAWYSFNFVDIRSFPRWLSPAHALYPRLMKQSKQSKFESFSICASHLDPFIYSTNFHTSHPCDLRPCQNSASRFCVHIFCPSRLLRTGPGWARLGAVALRSYVAVEYTVHSLSFNTIWSAFRKHHSSSFP